MSFYGLDAVLTRDSDGKGYLFLILCYLTLGLSLISIAIHVLIYIIYKDWHVNFMIFALGHLVGFVIFLSVISQHSKVKETIDLGDLILLTLTIIIILGLYFFTWDVYKKQKEKLTYP